MDARSEKHFEVPQRRNRNGRENRSKNQGGGK